MPISILFPISMPIFNLFSLSHFIWVFISYFHLYLQIPFPGIIDGWRQEPTLFLGHGSDNRCRIGAQRNVPCKVIGRKSKEKHGNSKYTNAQNKRTIKNTQQGKMSYQSTYIRKWKFRKYNKDCYLCIISRWWVALQRCIWRGQKVCLLLSRENVTGSSLLAGIIRFHFS